MTSVVLSEQLGNVLPAPAGERRRTAWVEPLTAGPHPHGGGVGGVFCGRGGGVEGGGSRVIFCHRSSHYRTQRGLRRRSVTLLQCKGLGLGYPLLISGSSYTCTCVLSTWNSAQRLAYLWLIANAETKARFSRISRSLHELGTCMHNRKYIGICTTGPLDVRTIIRRRRLRRL